MNKTVPCAFLGAAFGLLLSAGGHAAEAPALAASVKSAVAANPSDVLSIVERNVSANSGSACEVVKSAIEASHADAGTVASIVRVASTAAPDQMRIIAQCSLAAAPDAVTQVQAVLAKLDPASGSDGYSAKEAGHYLWAKDVRLGSAVPTKDASHYKVYDVNKVFLGDLRVRTATNTAVRATGTDSTVTWIYFAHVPVPGTDWTQADGGILTILNAESGDFYLQYEGSDFNPLNFPGQGFVNPGPPNTNGGSNLLPPGPGPNIPPVITPTPTTQTSFVF